MKNDYSSNERQIRVFISSTFKDMENEREHLIKKVFPKIRKLCRDRGVEFTEIDLRWGITKEESENGKTIEICLEEIDRCKPYFIGILGERYGWVPKLEDVISNTELGIKYPQVLEAINQGLSVTEIEIMHGVLDNDQLDQNTFFYFMKRENVNDYEIPSYDDKTHKYKLAKLKENIRSRGLNLKDNITNIEKLGDLVSEDLHTLINKTYPSSHTPTLLEREKNEHESFSKSRRHTYVPNSKYIKVLNEHILYSENPLVIYGESGIGKSSLLSYWSHLYRRKDPSVFLIEHYIGATSNGSSHLNLLIRIMKEIKERYSIEDEIPKKADEIETTFPLWLAKVSQGKLVIIVDAINQFENENISWLPDYFPSNIKLIISTTTEKLRELRKRKWSELELEPLGNKQKKFILEGYLSKFTKKLVEKEKNLIIENKKSNNPLFLLTVLEELRVHGNFDNLANHISYYMECDSLDTLFMRVLERMERDYGKEVVKEVTKSIWASRKGLSENELREIKDFSHIKISRLILALDYHLTFKDGLYNFFHNYLREAVKKRYLDNKEALNIERARIVSYFENTICSIRKADELPWQFYQLSENKRLWQCITDIDMFNHLFESDRYELWNYWKSSRGESNTLKAFKKRLIKFEKDGEYDISKLSLFKYHFGIFLTNFEVNLDEAEWYLNRVTKLNEKLYGRDHPYYAAALNGLASVFNEKERYDDAEQLYRTSFEIYEKSLGQEHTSTTKTINDLAMVLHAKGNYEEAEKLFRHIVKIRDKTPSDKYNTSCLTNLAETLKAKGEYKEAEELLREALELNNKAKGVEHPDTLNSVNNLAEMLKIMGDLEKAHQMHYKVYKKLEQKFGISHPLTGTSMLNLAEVLREKGNYKEAEQLYKQVIQNYKKVYGTNHTSTAAAMHNLSIVLKDKNNYSKAEKLSRQVIQITKTVLGWKHIKTAHSLKNLGDILTEKGVYEEAEQIYIEALKIYKKIVGTNHSHTAKVLNNLAMLLQATGNYGEAENLLKRVIKIHRKIYGTQHSLLATNLCNLGDILRMKGDLEEATRVLEEAVRIDLVTLSDGHPDRVTTLNNLATVLIEKGNYDKAEAMLRKVLQIDIENFGECHSNTATSINNLAALLMLKRNYNETEILYRQVVNILKKVKGPGHPDTAMGLFNLALLLDNKEEYEEAEKNYKHATKISFQKLGKSHPYTKHFLKHLELLMKLRERSKEFDKFTRRYM